MHSTILKNDKYQLLKIIKTKRVLKCLLYLYLTYKPKNAISSSRFYTTLVYFII
jgi:hypothetical protein